MSIKVIPGIMLLIIFSSFVSAMYVGESIYYDFQDDVDVIKSIDYDILSNDGDVKINIDINDTGAIVSVDSDSPLGEFEIEFKVNGEDKVYVSSNSNTKKSSSSKESTTKIFTIDNETYIGNTSKTLDVLNNESNITLVDYKEKDLKEKDKIIWIIFLLLIIFAGIYFVYKIRKNKKDMKQDIKQEVENKVDIEEANEFIEGEDISKDKSKILDDLLDKFEIGDESKERIEGGDLNGNKKRFKNY